MKRYFVKEDTRQIAKNQKPYANLFLVDEEGLNIETKVWDATFDNLKGKVIEADLINKPYQGKKSFVVDRFIISDNQTWKIFFPGDIFNEEKLTLEACSQRIGNLIEGVEDESCKKVVQHFILNDWERFSTKPGAMKIHHAFTGGLMLHTLMVTEIAVQLYERYKSYFRVLSRDLIVTGALIHDYGKILEYSGSEIGDMVDEEFYVLVGHIAYMIQAIVSLFPFPDTPRIIKDLIHIVQSHHLNLEWGSPTTPTLPEAMIVAYADHVDGRLGTALELIRDNPEALVIRDSWHKRSIINPIVRG